MRRPPRLLTRLAAVAAAGAATVVLSGCDVPNFGLPSSATRQGDHTVALWRGVVIAALCVGVLVWGLIFYSIVAYRRRRNDDGEVPGQRQYNHGLEIFYTIIPVLIVAVVFVFAVQAEHRIDNHTKAATDITVYGFQWQWQFKYPADDITVTGNGAGPYPELVVPAGETVQLRLISTDVVHSFWVPDFLFKRDLIPGVHNVVQFDVKKAGRYWGECAAFCGLDHARMDFVVHAVPPAQYRRWLAGNHGKSLTPGGNDTGRASG